MTQDPIKENRSRIINLETEVGNLRVETGRISATLSSWEKIASDRHETSKTSQFEIKELLNKRIRMDEEMEKVALEYREERERLEKEATLSRQRWMQGLLNPQTLIILLAVLLSIFGIRAADIIELPLSSASTEPAQSP